MRYKHPILFRLISYVCAILFCFTLAVIFNHYYHVSPVLQLVLLVLFACESATFIVMGPYRYTKEDQWFMEGLLASGTSLNQFNHKILSIGQHHEFFAAPVPWSFFAKYYIHNVGLIPRWSKSHRLIKQYYKQAKAKEPWPG